MAVATSLRTWSKGMVPRESAALRFTLLALVQSIGGGIFLTSSPYFFTRVVGISPGRVGLGLTVAGLVGLLGCVPMGIAGDRFGTRRILILIYLCLFALFGMYSLAQSFLWFVAIASAIALFESSCSPLTAALIYDHFETTESSIEVRAQVRSAINIGFPIGAAAAGIAIGVGTRSAFIAVVAATAIVHLLCAFLMTGLGGHGAPGERRGIAAVTPAALRDVRFLSVALINGLIQMNEVILTLGVPLWIVLHTEAPASINAVVLIANSVLVVAFQVVFSRNVTDAAAAARALRWAGLLIAVACLVYLLSRGQHTWVALCILLVGVAVQTIGEILQASASFTIAFELAVVDRLGEYQGVMALGAALRQFLGPVIVGSLVVGLGTAGWVVLCGVFAAFGVVATPLVHGLAHYRATGSTGSGRGPERKLE